MNINMKTIHLYIVFPFFLFWVTKRYNKRADDFKSLRFYNDYLELVEKRSKLFNTF